MSITHPFTSRATAFLIGLSALVCTQAGSIDQLESSFELIDDDDISITQGSLLTTFTTENWRTSLSLAHTAYDIDYQPVDFDFLGKKTRLKEHNTSLQINSRRTLKEGLWLLLGAGTYDGFTSYRSIWLDEYFKQQYSEPLDPVPGESYVFADPKGYNATVGGRWEYSPGVGYAQLTLSTTEDDVSPGYEIDFEGLQRGDLTLNTHSASISTENILTKRIRSLFELRASETTGRSTRYGAQLSINTALSEKFIWQLRIGGASEDPSFTARYINSKIEYNINEQLSIYIDASYYEDTGEVEDSFLFTNASPELVSRRVGAGLRWTNENWTGRVYIAPFSSRFDNSGANSDFFSNLYKDRDWTVAQIAFGKTF